MWDNPAKGHSEENRTCVTDVIRGDQDYASRVDENEGGRGKRSRTDVQQCTSFLSQDCKPWVSFSGRDIVFFPELSRFCFLLRWRLSVSNKQVVELRTPSPRQTMTLKILNIDFGIPSEDDSVVNDPFDDSVSDDSALSDRVTTIGKGSSSEGGSDEDTFSALLDTILHDFNLLGTIWTSRPQSKHLEVRLHYCKICSFVCCLSCLKVTSDLVVLRSPVVCLLAG